MIVLLVLEATVVVLLVAHKCQFQCFGIKVPELFIPSVLVFEPFKSGSLEQWWLCKKLKLCATMV